MAFSVLTVNGTAYNQSARKANSLLIDGWGWDVDGDFTADFHEVCAGPQPKFNSPFAVSITDPGGTLRFTGDIAGVYPTWTETGRSWGYRCLGFKYRANQVPVTAIDGTGTIVYNLPFTDEDYIAANSGLSVGTIVSTVLTDHATALSAVGITTDATTASQLAAITLVPNDPVYIEGARLWQSLEAVFQRWQKNLRLVILPTGLVRVVDVTLGAAHTLTLGSDPVDPPLFSRSWENCATRYVARGKGKIYPGYVDLIKGTLTPSWTNPAQQNAWKFSEFSNPTGATDTGTVTSVTSSTTVTVQSSDATRTWATNFWNGIQAWVQLFKSSGGGAMTYQESRPVTACTSLGAGGTSVLTLGYALDNSAGGAYDSYKLTGLAPLLADGGLNAVWRLFDVTDPGFQIAHHLVKKFPVAFPFQFLNNIAAVNTLFPIAQIITPSAAFNATFKVIPQTGQILFDRPVCEQLNSASVLATGGAGVVGPSNIYAMLAYSRGALSTVYPPDSGGPVYSGTAYSISGLERTRYGDIDSYAYEGNNAIVNGYAQNQQQALRDTVISGKVTYKGAYSAIYDPSGGHLLNFAGNGYTTGDEALNIPVRSVQVQYVNEGGAGVNYITTAMCDTRRDPRTGDSFYMHLSQRGSGQGAFQDFFNPFGVAQPSFGDMRAMAQANDSTSHLMDMPQEQGWNPDAMFAGPGQNASQKRRRERLHEQQRRKGTYDREETKSQTQITGEQEAQYYETEQAKDDAAAARAQASADAQEAKKAAKQKHAEDLAAAKKLYQNHADEKLGARIHRENNIPIPQSTGEDEQLAGGGG